MRYEINNFTYFDRVIRYLKAQPLNLAGYIGYSGGTGGGPGYVGVLPQTRVAYDRSEAETDFTPTTSASLLDNLNHIRYRISEVEAIASGGITIQLDGVEAGNGVTVLNFIEDFELGDVTGEHYVEIRLATPEEDTITALSGVHGVDLSNQIGASETHFDVGGLFTPGYLRVYYNGLRQDPSLIIEDGDFQGFTTDFTVYSGDAIVVDYDVLISGMGILSHAHSNYVTYDYAYENFFPASGIGSYFNEFALTEHTHIEDDITDLSHNADYLQSTPVSVVVPSEQDILQYVGGYWYPIPWTGMVTTITGITKTIQQQMLFSYEGILSETGTKPLKVAANYVGDSGSVDEIYLTLGTAPTSTAVRVNILKNGVTILDSPSYIECGVGNTVASKTTGFADQTIAYNDYFQYQLVQGDVSAANMVVHVRYSWEV